MREILFRGKTPKGEWRYGAFEDYDGNCLIGNYGSKAKVIPETVGQYTGLTDKNGKKIFEGDIVKVDVGTPFKIEYKEKYAKFCMCSNTVAMASCNFSKLEVIGNIHDNPELIEERT